MIIADGCVVTLKDSAVNNGGGTVVSRSLVGKSVNSGTIKIESGNYSSTGDYCFWAGGRNETGSVIVEDATITGQEGAVAAGKDSTIVVNGGLLTGRDNAVLASNGSAGYEGAQITVNDGEFVGEIQTSGYTGCGVYFPNDGVLTINGGTFNVAGVGIAARAGQVNINGGAFVSTVDTAGWVGDKKTQLSANGIYYDGAAKYPGLVNGAKLTITGGTFTNTADATIPAVKVTQPADAGFEITVEPGDWSIAE